MENRHILQRKLGTCQGKEVRVKIKGAHIRGGKGRGHYYKLIGALLCKKGAYYKVKGALFGYLKKWGGTVPPLPPPPPQVRRLCVSVYWPPILLIELLNVP